MKPYKPNTTYEEAIGTIIEGGPQDYELRFYIDRLPVEVQRTTNKIDASVVWHIGHFNKRKAPGYINTRDEVLKILEDLKDAPVYPKIDYGQLRRQRDSWWREHYGQFTERPLGARASIATIEIANQLNLLNSLLIELLKLAEKELNS